MGTRQRIAATDAWQQRALLVGSAEQRTYALIRPVVLFGHSPAERARMTGAPQRTLSRQAARFEREGMTSLVGPPKVERHRTLPENMRRHIRALKAEHPAFRANEIAKICAVHFGRRPSPHTVKRLLAETPPVPVATRRYPPYQRIAEPDARRHAVVSLHSEGWNKQSIADYLQIDPRTVYEILRRWIAEGTPGLYDKSHARLGPRKTDLHAMLTVKQLQENPELGAFRIHAKLQQRGIHLSPPGALWADAVASSRRSGSTACRRHSSATAARSL